MASTKKEKIEFKIGFQPDKSSLQQVKASIDQILRISPKSFAGPKEQLIQIKNQARLVKTALQQAFNTKINTVNVETFKSSLQQAGTSLQTVYNNFQKIGFAGETAFGRLASSVLTSNLQLKQTSSFMQDIGTTLMNSLRWSVASRLIQGFSQSVSQAFTYVKSLDSSLNDIRIVTKDSANQMANFAVQANKAANELGRSTLDYTKAALTFYQQGLNDQEVKARTQATLKAQNITGSGKEMADYLTAVWNGYQVINEEIELYVDKLAAVADSSASNMSQLAIGMSKVASTANLLGVDIDRLTAQIATIVATTRQAPESVGNALKTIYARINDIKAGTDDAEISLGNYTKEMNKVGISVLDASGHLRDTGDVIDEIGSKWNNFSKQQQIFLARTMAGQRQYNNLLALFENWSKYTDLVNVSLEAEGSTAEKNAIYLQSLAAHTEKLGAAQQKLKSSMVDSDTYKGLLDFATGATKGMAHFIESIGGGGTAVLALGSIVTQVFGGVISREINQWVINSKAASDNLQILNQDIQNTKAFGQIEGLTQQTVQRIVQAKEEIQGYYKVMSTEQINAYQNKVKEIAQLSQEYEIRNHILELMQAADKFDTNRNSKGMNYTGLLNQIKDLTQPLISGKSYFGHNAKEEIQKIAEEFKFLQSASKEFFGTLDKELGGSLSKFASLSKETISKLSGSDLSGNYREAVDAALRLKEVLQKSNPTYLDNQNKLTDAAKQKLDDATISAQRFRQEMGDLSKVSGIVGLTSSVGRLASAFLSLKNIINTINNDSISGFEKLLQILTSLGFASGMILTSFHSMREAAQKLVLASNAKIIDSTNQQIKIERQKQLNTLKQIENQIGRDLVNNSIAQTKLAIEKELHAQRLDLIKRNSLKSDMLLRQQEIERLILQNQQIKEEKIRALALQQQLIAKQRQKVMELELLAIKAEEQGNEAAALTYTKLAQQERAVLLGQETAELKLKQSISSRTKAITALENMQTANQKAINELKIEELEAEITQNKEKLRALYLSRGETKEIEKRLALLDAELKKRKNQSFFGMLGERLSKLFSNIGKFFSNNPWAGWALAAVAAITIITVAIKSIKSELEKAKEEADKWNKEVQKSHKYFSEVNDEITEVNNSMKSLSDATSALNDLTVGTDEWRAKLAEVNQQILDLIQKYPILKQYLQVDANGQMGFKEGAFGAVQEGLQGQRESALAGYIYSQRASSEANNNLIIIEKVEEIVNQFKKDGININKKDLQHLTQLAAEKGIQNLTLEDFDFDKDGEVSDLTGQFQLWNNKDVIFQNLISTIQNNIQATNNLIEATVKTSVDFQKIKGYSSLTNEKAQQAYIKAYGNGASFFGENDLDKNKYYKNLGYTNQEQGEIEYQLNKEKLVESFEKILSASLGVAIDIIEDQNEKGKYTYQYGGKVVELTEQSIISGVAYAENKSKLDQKITERITELLDIDQDALIFANGLDNVDIGQLSQNKIDKFFANKDDIATALGFNNDSEVKKALDQYGKKIDSHMKQFIANKLTPSVQTAFNSIDKKNLEVTAQKQIGKALQDAFNKGFDVTALASFYNRIQDFDKFNDLITEIDFNTITVGQFEAKLKAVGIATNMTTEELQAYINAQKTTAEIVHQKNQQDYKNAQNIANGIKQDGIVSPQQVKTLTEMGFEVKDFMDITLDGGGKLKVAVEDLKTALKNFTTQKFRDEVEQLQNKLDRFNSINAEDLNQGIDISKIPALPTSPSFNPGGGGIGKQNDIIIEKKYQGDLGLIQEKFESQKAYVELLRDQNKLNDEELKQVSQILNNRKNVRQLSQDEADILINIIKAHPDLIEQAGKWEGTIDQINTGLELAEETTKRIFDEDVDQKKLNRLAEFFNQYDGKIEGYDEIFQKDKQAAEDLAEQLLRFDSALEKVKSNYQNWKNTLLSGNDAQIGLILPDLANAYSDLLDIDPSVLGDGFLRSADNLKLFYDVLDGTKEQAENAYNQLQRLALLQIAPELNTEEFDSKLRQVLERANQIEKDTKIDIGATINDREFLEACDEIIRKTAKTEEEAVAMWKQFGVEAKVRETSATNIPIVAKVPEIRSYIEEYGNPEQQVDGFRIMYNKLYDYDTITGNIAVSGFTLSGDAKKAPSPGNKIDSSSTRTSHQASKKPSGGSKNKPKKNKGSGKGQKAKTSNKDLGFETKEDTYDPYEQVTKQLGRQSELLEKLQDQQDKLTGKDRLQNLKEQNKVLKEQNKWLVERQKISRDKNNKGTTANLRKQLRSKDMFGKNISFDSDGQITDEVATQNWAIGEYNKTIQKAEEDYKKVEDKYNDYITKTWNKHGKAWQEKHKDDKQRWDERLKQAEEDAKNSKDAAEKLYKKRTDAINEYLDRLKEDKQFYGEFLDNIEKIIENNLSQHKIKVDIRLEVGDFERQWLNFRDKFIENITDKDFTKKAISDLENLTSYLDSKQLSEALTSMQTSQNNIKILQNRLKNVNKITDQQLDILGITRKAWDEMEKPDRIAKLKEGIKFEADQVKEINTGIQNSLISMQEKADAIKETLLSTYDELSKNQQDRMEQLDRAKDVIQHGMKMSQMTFGEKSYQIMNKYYAELLRNDRRQLTNLKNYRNYWKRIYEEQVALGDKANKKLKEKALEQMNSWAEKTRAKVEQLAEHSAKQLEIKMEATIDQVLADLTGGLGEQFRDAEWDKLKEYDDNFLDVAETKMGIEEVQRLYNEVGESIKGNSDQAKRFNEFQQKQINLLKNKQHLTQYDLDRAKAALEVEQARYELEQARDQKTQLRLRRDSQGNYTYQYVADEQALDKKADELQDKIANLYKMDKDAYIKNLELIQNKGREYYEEMTKLEKEYAEAEAAGDQARLQRLVAQMEMTQKHYSQFLEGLMEDNQIIYKTYSPESWGESMGEEFESIDDAFQKMIGSVPIFNSTLQTYVNSMIGKGGIINAFQSSLDKAKGYIAKDYANIADALKEQGTSIQDVSKGLKGQVNSEEKVLDYYTSLIIASKQQIKNVTTLLNQANEFIKNLKETTQLLDRLLENYKLLQGLENFDGKRIEGTKLANIDMNNITAVKKAVDGLFNSLLNSLPQKDVSSYASGGYTGEWENEAGKIAFLHQKELVLNANDTSNILSAVQTVRDITSGMSIDNDLQALSNSQSALLGSLLSSTQLDQNVHIEANFPNVTQHTQIEQAFANLVNIASMHASKRNN